MSRPGRPTGATATPLRLHLTISKVVWRELTMIANRDDMRIQDVAVQAIEKYLNSIPPAERPQPLGTYGMPRTTPMTRVRRKRFYDSPVEVTIQGPTADAIPAEALLPPEPKEPTWSEIWKRLKDHLHEAPAWDELQSYLKGVTPPNDILQWKFDRQVAWFNAYAPLQQ